jgi:hypothetical protein
MRDAMNIRSYQPAKEFFRVRDEEFIPAVRRGDRETARALANSTLKTLYEQHRKAVLQVVHLALIQNSLEEESATSIAEQRTTLIPMIGLVIAGITITVALWISRRILRGIEQTDAGGATAARPPRSKAPRISQLRVATNQMVRRCAMSLPSAGARDPGHGLGISGRLMNDRERGEAPAGQRRLLGPSRSATTSRACRSPSRR